MLGPALRIDTVASSVLTKVAITSRTLCTCVWSKSLPFELPHRPGGSTNDYFSAGLPTLNAGMVKIDMCSTVGEVGRESTVDVNE